MFLSELQPNSKGKVKRLKDRDLEIMLLEHGLMQGQIVEVLYKAPFNGPIAVQINHNVVSLRKSEAESVELDLLS